MNKRELKKAVQELINNFDFKDKNQIGFDVVTPTEYGDMTAGIKIVEMLNTPVCLVGLYGAGKGNNVYVGDLMEKDKGFDIETLINDVIECAAMCEGKFKDSYFAEDIEKL